MLNSKDKIELALRSGMIAKSSLQLLEAKSKIEVKMIRNQTVELLIELDQKIKELPED